jgi:hypothetical protein
MDRLRFPREIVRGKRKSLGLFDRLAGRGGLDGNTHASLVSLPDRLTSNHSGHQTLDAFIDPFHAFSLSRTRVRFCAGCSMRSALVCWLTLLPACCDEAMEPRFEAMLRS